jgi:hypothetical protein
MPWNQLEKLLPVSGPGVKNYDEFAGVCIELAQKHSDNALPLFLLSVVAERFADAYREAPLSVAESQKRSNILINWVKKFHDISQSKSAEKYLITNSFVSQELGDW